MPLDYLIELLQAFRSGLLDASEESTQQQKAGYLAQFTADRAAETTWQRVGVSCRWPDDGCLLCDSVQCRLPSLLDFDAKRRVLLGQVAIRDGDEQVRFVVAHVLAGVVERLERYRIRIGKAWH